MKKPLIAVTVVAMLGTVAVSCQKETSVITETTGTEQTAVYGVTYTVDGQSRYLLLHGDEELHLFLRGLVGMTREGHSVSVVNGYGPANEANTKEVVTYHAKDEDDAAAWMSQMIKDGYIVSSYFDEETGEIICIARK